MKKSSLFWTFIAMAAAGCVRVMMDTFASPVSAAATRLGDAKRCEDDRFSHLTLTAAQRPQRSAHHLGLLRIGRHFVFTTFASLRTRHSSACGYRPAS